MNEESNSADKGEPGKRSRNDLAEQLIGDQHDIFPGDERIEFALAALPFPELVGQFPEPQGPRRRRQDIQENLDCNIRNSFLRT